MDVPTPEQWQDIARRFDELIALPPEARVARLAAYAAQDPAAAEQVRSLLFAADRDGDFLDHAAVDDLPIIVDALEAPPGHRIGAYRIERLIGRGGMGEVYLAGRADGQYQQRVALKLIQPGAVAHIDQFQNERQILAGLDHPGIARLLDGGVADDGRPYMVMEYVEGSDLSSHASAARLSLKDRLDLFGQVCDAVAYAHRHLVIHRDLKPANILVTDEGRVKLLDFGIAKLLQPAAVATGTQTRALTPEYAAPEQLERRAATTATDVYSLGVVLYELLTGEPPWDIRDAPLALALDQLLHKDPLPPSARAERAAHHAPVPARLLGGDLDSIVLKALRKEPNQRYDNAAALWADLERYRNAEPVQARPPTAGYLLRRHLRRHRALAAGIAAVLTSLVLGAAGIAWQAHRATLERDQARREAARAEAVRDYVMLMFRTAREEHAEGPVTAKAVLDLSAARLESEYAGNPALQAQLFQTLGRLYMELDDYEGATPLLTRFLEAAGPEISPEIVAESRSYLAEAYFRRGDVTEAEKLLTQAQGYWMTDPARHRALLLDSRGLQSRLERARGQPEQALQTLRAALAESINHHGKQHYDTVVLTNSLAAALLENNQVDEAARTIAEAWDGVLALGKERSASALVILNNRAMITTRQKNLPEAERLFRQALALRQELYGPSTALAVMQINLGNVLVKTGRPQEAATLLTAAVQMAQQYSGEASPVTLSGWIRLASAQVAMGDFKTADETLASALERGRSQLGDGHILVANGEIVLAELRWRQGRGQEARSIAEQTAAKVQTLGPAGTPLQESLGKLRAEFAAVQAGNADR